MKPHTFFGLFLSFAILLSLFVGCVRRPTPTDDGGGSTDTQAVINSPRDGSKIAGTLFFSVQPFNPSEVESVSFNAGDTDLGTDTTAEDGFKVFLAAKDYPAGALKLSATVKAKNGKTSTQAVTVDNVPSPPSSATVTQDGAVLGTVEENGALSTLVIPAGANEGAEVSFEAKTKAEVKAATGVDYDALGVTFLGAQEISSSEPVDQTLMVASGGFGPQVQPGQAVVNYRIVPDADGDGVGELVVVNSASVAPNGDVISDPIPQPVIKAVNGAGVSSQANETITATAGDFITLDVSGMNPYSLKGNIARVKDSGGETYDLIGSVDQKDGTQSFVFQVPAFFSGSYALTLRSETSGLEVSGITLKINPIDISVGNPDEEIDTYFTYLEEGLKQLPSELDYDETEVLAKFSEAKESLKEAYRSLGAIEDEAERLETGAVLDGVVTSLMKSTEWVEMTALSTSASSLCDDPFMQNYLSALTVAGGVIGAYGFFSGNPIVTAVGVSIGIAGAILTVADWLFRATECDDEPPPPPGPSGGGTTGMGSAPPRGGSGVGGAGGPSSSSSSLLAQQTRETLEGRIHVKILSSGRPQPFTGITDAGGYFYIPLIPENQPFTAVAYDVVTGAIRTFKGTGPEVGKAVFMYFDFSDGPVVDPDPGPEVELNTNTKATLTVGETDVYTFEAGAGQLIRGALMAGEYLTDYLELTITAPSGEVTASIISRGYGTTEVLTLAETGTYTITIDSPREGVGEYIFGLSTVEQPEPISLDILRSTLSGDLKILGERKYYAFNATTDDLYKFTIAYPKGSFTFSSLRILKPGTEPFFERERVGNAVASLGGTNQPIAATFAFEFPENGEYVLEISSSSFRTLEENTGPWEVTGFTPTFESVSVGDTVTGTVTFPGELKGYSFTVSEEQTVFFDLIEVPPFDSGEKWDYLNWWARGPDGEYVFYEEFGLEVGAYTLSEGTYQILIGANNGLGVGDYSFQLRPGTQ